MERYTKWADRQSHINPFIPPSYALPKRLAPRLLVLAFGSLLSITRIAALAVVAVLLSLSLCIASPAGLLVFGIALALLEHGAHLTAGAALAGCGVLSWTVPSLASAFRRYAAGFWFRTAFFLLNVRVEECHADLRRLGLQPSPLAASVAAAQQLGGAAGRRRGRPGADVGAGDLIVCNHMSFLESLYLDWRFGPVHAVVATAAAAPSGTGTNGTAAAGTTSKVAAVGLFGALRAAVQPPWATLRKPAESLGAVVDLAARRGAAVTVFPEAARTNGDGVLEFSRVLDGLVGSTGLQGIHLAGFSYRAGGGGGGGFAPVHPVGSLARQLFWMCFSFWPSTMTVTFLDEEYVPPHPLLASIAVGPAVRTAAAAGASASTPTLQPSPAAPTAVTAAAGAAVTATPRAAATWTERVRELVAGAAGKGCLALSRDDAASFARYWDLLRRDDRDAAAGWAEKRKKH